MVSPRSGVVRVLAAQRSGAGGVPAGGRRQLPFAAPAIAACSSSRRSRKRTLALLLAAHPKAQVDRWMAEGASSSEAVRAAAGGTGLTGSGDRVALNPLKRECVARPDAYIPATSPVCQAKKAATFATTVTQKAATKLGLDDLWRSSC